MFKEESISAVLPEREKRKDQERTEEFSKGKNKGEYNIFSKQRRFEVLDKYFPQYAGLSVEDIALKLKHAYAVRLKEMDYLFDVLSFDALWFGDIEQAKPILALLIEVYGSEIAKEKINKWINETPRSDAVNASQKRFSTDQIKLDILLFKHIFRTAIKENPKMNLGDFNDIDIRSNVENITGEDAQEMRKNIENNYIDEKERRIALAGLEKGLANKDNSTVFNILGHKGRVVSSFRFDRNCKPGVSYFGSFSTDPEFQGAYIGEAVMKEGLQAELASHAEAIEAHALPDKKITSKYIEEAGFIIEDIELNYLGTSKALFKIRRDDKINQRYKFRGEIKREDKKFFEIMAGSGATTESGNPFLKIETDKINDTAVLEKIKTFMQKHNLVITRYFPDDKKNPKYYILAFETRISESESDNHLRFVA